MGLRNFFRRLTGGKAPQACDSVETVINNPPQYEQESGFHTGTFSIPGAEDMRPTLETPALGSTGLAARASRPLTRGGISTFSRGVLPMVVPSLGERAQVYRLSATLRAKDEPERAMELWEACLELCPEDQDGWFALGMLRFEHGDMEAAGQAFEAARHGPMKNPLALGMLGYLATTRGEWRAAVDYYSEAVEICPTRIELLKGLLASQEAVGMPEEEERTRRLFAGLL